jgi:MOSC domain-containing protein YiiM
MSAGAAVVALQLSYKGRQPMTPVTRATAVEDHGITGDRHSLRNNRRALLLVESEILDQFGLAPGEVREQVTVRGLDLCGLAKGSRLRIGGAVFELAGLCAPCELMDELQPGLRARIDGRRGRFVRVVEGGELSVGDIIVVEPPA